MKLKPPALLFFLTVTVTACATDAPLVPSTDEPYVYLLLSTDPIDGSQPSDSTLSAFLLTMGSPIRTTFRHASRFELRSTDRALPFQWIERVSGSGQTVGFRGVPADSANYYLPRDSSAAGLGSRNLRESETYTLNIESDGYVITGSTEIPAKALPRIIENGSTKVIVWRRSAAAGAYVVVSDTENVPALITTDTTYVLRYSRDPSTIPPDPRFTVIALDKNATQFFLHPELPRAGLSSGFGLYGSASVTRIAVPKTP